MKSPFTGGKAVLRQEDSELVFRKEKFKFTYLYYQCEDTKERFTTTEIDEINLSQVYNQYRIKYGIPFPDEIRKIRKAYDLPASKMSEILGFGENQYRLYENGDIPSETNGKILNSIKRPDVFMLFVENARNQFEAKDYERILSKLKKAMEIEQPDIREALIFESYSRGIYNGYAALSYSKLRNIILFFIEKCGDTFNTKMNKLLFYSDFLSYRTYGYGMTGLAYKAILHGPVPVKWDRVYSLMDDVCQEIVEFPSGISGTKLCSTVPPDYSSFSTGELKILNSVLDKFKDVSASEISGLNHNEDIWKKYSNTNQLIDYREAFTLKAFESLV
jgi:uncharacterized phage-associated protein/DNA-binding transcriptional regulator YiaG